MLSPKIEQALNDQVNKEMYSAYLYLQMSAWLGDNGLPGASQWMRIQAREELLHGMKLVDHVGERGGSVVLGAIEAPQTEWKGPLPVFEAAFGHEQMITASINDLVDLAVQERDHATQSFLLWFVNEQVEEEAGVKEIVDKLRLVGDAAGALFMIDQELGGRQPEPMIDGSA